jgi:hypothetical protein
MAKITDEERPSETPEYQHYVPQFILRNYTDYIRPKEEDFEHKKDFDKARKKAKKGMGAQTIEFENGFARSGVVRRSTEKIFGLFDMYNEKFNGDEDGETKGEQGDKNEHKSNEIERKLSQVEIKASEIVNKIKQRFLDGATEVFLREADINTLKRFMFIMIYRNQEFSELYEFNNDALRQSLEAYMEANELKTLKEIWLRSLRAFIDVDFGQPNWSEWVLQRAYHHDAFLFIHYMKETYICLCTPEDDDDEFLLTQNIYNILEGTMHTDGNTVVWHTFCPAGSRLLILSRSDLLSGISTGSQSYIDRHHEKWTALYEPTMMAFKAPTAKFQPSLLKELPVGRPHYSNYHLSQDHANVPVSFSNFGLPSKWVQRINSLLLEHAISTTHIIFKSKLGLQKALEAYFAMEDPNFKVVMEASPKDDCQSWLTDTQDQELTPEVKRQAYLAMLQKIFREQFGRVCSVNATPSARADKTRSFLRMSDVSTSDTMSDPLLADGFEQFRLSQSAERGVGSRLA